MVTSLDKFMPTLADKLLTKYGKQITITTNTLGAYDPTASGPSSSTSVSQTCACIIEEFPDALRTLGDGIIKDSDSVIDGDKKVMVAAKNLTFIPKSGDRVTVDGQIYNIIGSGSQYSGELVAYYSYHVRKA